jgi:hypothetical protein
MKEKFLHDTLNSIDSMQRAKTSPNLQARILASVPKAKAKIVSMPPSQRWAAAASILFLIGLNIVLLGRPRPPQNPLCEEYFSFYIK